MLNREGMQEVHTPVRRPYEHLNRSQPGTPAIPQPGAYTSVETIQMNKQMQQQHKIQQQQLLREKQAKELELQRLLEQQQQPALPPRPPKRDAVQIQQQQEAQLQKQDEGYEIIDATEKEKQRLYLERLSQEQKVEEGYASVVDRPKRKDYEIPSELLDTPSLSKQSSFAHHEYLPPAPRDASVGPPLPPRIERSGSSDGML
jgi:hypothetical protein